MFFSKSLTNLITLILGIVSDWSFHVLRLEDGEDGEDGEVFNENN